MSAHKVKVLSDKRSLLLKVLETLPNGGLLVMMVAIKGWDQNVSLKMKLTKNYLVIIPQVARVLVKQKWIIW